MAGSPAHSLLISLRNGLRSRWCGRRLAVAGLWLLGGSLIGGAACAMPMASWRAMVSTLVAIPAMGGEESGGSNPQQVHIQQRLSIRITPGGPAMPPAMMFEMDEEDRPARLEARRFGRCLPVAAIAGVQSSGANRLMLFLRDTRVVIATLPKACRANDFYSGFYVDRNADGQLCIDRDKIHARSGATCMIRDMRLMVEAPPRR